MRLPKRSRRRAHIERFEERLALSADPLLELHAGVEAPLLEAHANDQDLLDSAGDFQLESLPERRVSMHDGGVSTSLADVHDWTGVTYVRNTYGFSGQGQTVAIVDSGIAYDHLALGGGFGAGQRVVGGWDFAENDANPYDDGPAGFHGTHVAGIVGSDNATYRGVASGVDMVGLRVFDDSGAGYFSWVESALQWVHDHRNDFANPITTVNLSLGTTWNSDSIPGWAMLEDEFAQLESDGIFIAVSAGNSFASYNDTGLSYPAASPYVVPVSSVDNDGSMSSFSQRHERVLAAPGRSITSTVPDHVFGADGNPNDFGTASGTSMAAPYVAGASALVREAMEFVGYSVVTQDAIYDHLRSTADIFYDAATSANYHRLNVQAALDALMPGDDYGSSLGTAQALGVLSDTSSISGLIGTLTDEDYFTFTAGASGTISFATEATHALQLDAQLVGGGGSFADGTLSFDVVAGQSYTIALGTDAGIGYYDVDVTLDSGMADLGTVDFQRLDNLAVSGESWFQFTAGRTGTLTAEGRFAHAAGNVELELYNASNQLLARAATAEDVERIDLQVNAGDLLQLRLAGTNSDVQLRVANLVAASGDTFQVFGSAAADTMVAHAGDMSVVVNGLRYESDPGTTHITIDAGGGADTIRLYGTEADDTATMRPHEVLLAGGDYQLSATGGETVTVFGLGGANRVDYYDSAGNETFVARAGLLDSYMFGDSGFHNHAKGFRQAFAHATAGGDDRAHFYDSAGNDSYYARAAAGDAYMYGAGGYYHYANGFDRNYAYASGGDDRAYLYDSAGDDTFISSAQQNDAVLYGDGFYNYARGFARYTSYATAGGYDRATFYDSAGDDVFRASGYRADAVMYGSGYYGYANGFDRYEAYATSGGRDEATLYDSGGSDTFIARAGQGYSTMFGGGGFYNFAKGFDRVYAYATAGGSLDQAFYYDTAQDDRFFTRSESHDSYMFGGGAYNYAQGFHRSFAYASSGDDRAYFYDSSADDTFVASGHQRDAAMYGNGHYHYAQGFDRNHAYAGRGGNDRASFYDSAGDDTYVADAARSQSVMYGDGYYHFAAGFSRSYAYAVAGGANDRASFYDSSGDDTYVARAHYADQYMYGDGFYHYARGFDRSYSYAVAGGSDRAFLHDSAANDEYVARVHMNDSYMYSDTFYNYAKGFAHTRAFSNAGGNDRATFDGLSGNHTFYGRHAEARVEGVDGSLDAGDFESVVARAVSGEAPESDVDTLDYLFTELGDFR